MADRASPSPTRCCIVGGGPAGMMLGLLLARAGVNVLVLEKHRDFLRDFRGDTIHPSTLEVLHELRLLDDFLTRPHQQVQSVTVTIGDLPLQIGDFSSLPIHCPFVALMPQWDFLEFLADHARPHPNFRLRMEAEALDLISEDGVVTGLRLKTPEGIEELRADLVVAADGRRSILREKAGLPVRDLGAPMDVLWMRMSRLPDDPGQLLGRVLAGQMLVLIDRTTYWQCAYLIPKGGFAACQKEGIAAFRDKVRALAPFLGNRVSELHDWEDVKLLTVAVDRLERWAKPGLLCLGDAAHAMSPIGGVGINLAIQDAVAAANLLASPLQQGPVPLAILQKVQARRDWPTRATQRFQTILQNRLIRRVLESTETIRPPLLMRLFSRYRFLRRLPARIIGMGFQPEHIEVAEILSPSALQVHPP